MIATYFNLTLNILKWPIALLSLALLPFLFIELLALVDNVLYMSEAAMGFLTGVIIYGLLDYFIFGRHFIGSSFSTLEHEFTHAIFAWLTAHRVKGLKVTWRSGGHIIIVGGGNWLISIAPYFFPTLCILWMIISYLSPLQDMWINKTVLGASFMYHQLSTYRETHPQQSDFEKAGKLFSISFLPGANLFAVGWIIGGINYGFEGSWRFTVRVLQRAIDAYF